MVGGPLQWRSAGMGGEDTHYTALSGAKGNADNRGQDKDVHDGDRDMRPCPFKEVTLVHRYINCLFFVMFARGKISGTVFFCQC